MKTKLSALLLAGFALASVAGCKRDGKHGPVVAKVGSDTITAVVCAIGTLMLAKYSVTWPRLCSFAQPLCANWLPKYRRTISRNSD